MPFYNQNPKVIPFSNATSHALFYESQPLVRGWLLLHLMLSLVIPLVARNGRC